MLAGLAEKEAGLLSALKAATEELARMGERQRALETERNGTLWAAG
ncbi:hypothetical protein SAMN05216345_101876 [Cupriavidus sp. YR651]|nr:hypothetical protein [Cupriavidus sp. YR651]SDC19414.1 hypothetical protein SAMN05216345_101876 [Cupriavidus sp. YR651]